MNCVDRLMAVIVGNESNPLAGILNKRVEDPPRSPDEVAVRLAARTAAQEPENEPAERPSAESSAVSEPEDSAVPRDRPRAAVRRAPEFAAAKGPRDGGRAEPVDGSPSLAEVVAQLAAREAELKDLGERVASERVFAETPGGRLRVVATGDGRPVSLHIDKDVGKGPERHGLGPLIAELIMTARQQARARRRELEGELPATRSGLGSALREGGRDGLR